MSALEVDPAWGDKLDRGLLEMGLEVSPAILNRISAFAVPLTRSGTSAGFILIYRLDGQKLTIAELKNITSITTGLAAAVSACTTTNSV